MMFSESDLAITNTLFRLANKYKNTWMHPMSQQWHLTDYVITHRQDIHDVMITWTMKRAECWTDHRLVRLSFTSALPLCTVGNLNSLQPHSTPPNWSTQLGGRSFIYYSITHCMFMDHWQEIQMRSGPSSSRWLQSQQKLSLGQRHGSTKTGLTRTMMTSTSSERKVQSLYRMAKWCDIAINERPHHISEEKSPEGTVKNTG